MAKFVCGGLVRIPFFLLLCLTAPAAWSAGNPSLPAQPLPAFPPLTLPAAQAMALRDAPQLAAQRAATDAARQSVEPAGQQADPKLIVGIENLPVEGADRFRVTRDFMTMRRIGVMQDVVRGDKLRLRAERAEAESRREVSGLALAETTLQRDVALAWIDVHFALRQQQVLARLEAETRLQISAADAALAGGKSGTGEPFGARLMLAQLEERKLEVERQLARARAQLARWIGESASRPLGDAPDFARLPSNGADLRAQVERLPVLAQWDRTLDAARIEVQMAQADARPDWSWELVYAQRGPDFSNMLSFNVRIDLPIFQARRQAPLVAVKVAQQEQIRAQAEAAKREQIAEIESLRADWQAAMRRIDRYRSDLLPLARERSAAQLAAYRGGQGGLMPVVEARKAEIDLQLMQLQAEQEQARAWAQLSFLLPTTLAKEPS